jgi:hypothetical protein
MCKDFAPNFGDKRTGCCILTTPPTLPFSPGNFLPKTTLLLSPNQPTHLTWPPATFLFPQLKMKLKGCRSDTIEVTEAESQVVLNTLTENNFRDTLKKWQKHWEWYIYICGSGLLLG